MSRACLFVTPLIAPSAHTEITALDDERLSDVQGIGIGFVLGSAMVDSNKATIAINGVTNTTTGQNMPITVGELHVTVTGNNKGSTLTLMTLSRLSFPSRLNLARGSMLTTQLNDGRMVNTPPDTADMIELVFPSLMSGAGDQPCIVGYTGTGSNCSSRVSERVDADIRFGFGVTSTHTDVFSLDFSELAMDGSYLHSWGVNTRSQLVGETRLSLYAKTFKTMSYGAGSPSCVSAAEQAARTVCLTNAYASVTLGCEKLQPLLFLVTVDGNFTFGLPKLTLTDAADFYTNAPCISLMVENPNISDTRSGYRQVPADGCNMGRNEISGLNFNYPKVTSHNL